MRLTKKKIDDILKDVVGEEGLPIIHELLERSNISEFDLAGKTKKDIKVVRKRLYQLYNYNLVSFTRKKDKQKGWYIYYWTLLMDCIKYLYFKKKRERLASLQQQLEVERKELFFSCPSACVRLTFDQAMDFEFRCPECGILATQESSEKRVASLQQEIASLKQELKEEEERPKPASRKKEPVKKIKKKVKKEAKKKPKKK